MSEQSARASESRLQFGKSAFGALPKKKYHPTGLGAFLTWPFLLAQLIALKHALAASAAQAAASDDDKAAQHPQQSETRPTNTSSAADFGSGQGSDVDYGEGATQFAKLMSLRSTEQSARPGETANQAKQQAAAAQAEIGAAGGGDGGGGESEESLEGCGPSHCNGHNSSPCYDGSDCGTLPGGSIGQILVPLDPGGLETSTAATNSNDAELPGSSIAIQIEQVIGTAGIAVAFDGGESAAGAVVEIALALELNIDPAAAVAVGSTVEVDLGSAVGEMSLDAALGSPVVVLASLATTPGPSLEVETTVQANLAPIVDTGLALNFDLELDSTIDLTADAGLPANISQEATVSLVSTLGMELGLTANSDVSLDAAFGSSVVAAMPHGPMSGPSVEVETSIEANIGPIADAELALDADLVVDSPIVAGASVRLDADIVPTSTLAIGPPITNELESDVNISAGPGLDTGLDLGPVLNLASSPSGPTQQNAAGSIAPQGADAANATLDVGTQVSQAVGLESTADLTALLGPETVAGLDKPSAVSALEEIGLQGTFEPPLISQPDNLIGEAVVQKSEDQPVATVSAEVVEFSSLQMDGTVSSGSNIEFAPVSPNPAEQSNELFIGELYTEFNVALQVDIASSSAAAVADAEVGTTVTDDAALQDLTTQLAEQDSATAEGPLDAAEVVEIPVPLEELSIRALQI